MRITGAEILAHPQSQLKTVFPISVDADRVGTDRSHYIKTERLVLRRLRPHDVGDVTALVSDWDVAKQAGSIPFPYTTADAVDWIAYADAAWERGSEYIFAIERGTDMRLIGAMGMRLKRGWQGPKGHIGYWIGKPYWAHGYASEALGAFKSFCLNQVGMLHLVGTVFADNERSVRVLEKNGFYRQRLQWRTYPDRGGKRKVWVLQWSPGSVDAMS